MTNNAEETVKFAADMHLVSLICETPQERCNAVEQNPLDSAEQQGAF